MKIVQGVLYFSRNKRNSLSQVNGTPKQVKKLRTRNEVKQKEGKNGTKRQRKERKKGGKTRERKTDRQADRQRDRQINRQIDRLIKRNSTHGDFRIPSSTDKFSSLYLFAGRKLVCHLQVLHTHSRGNTITGN